MKVFLVKPPHFLFSLMQGCRERDESCHRGRQKPALLPSLRPSLNIGFLLQNPVFHLGHLPVLWRVYVLSLRLVDDVGTGISAEPGNFLFEVFPAVPVEEPRVVVEVEGETAEQREERIRTLAARRAQNEDEISFTMQDIHQVFSASPAYFSADEFEEMLRRGVEVGSEECRRLIDAIIDVQKKNEGGTT